MKKTWFCPRLYADGLKQLRLMGILFTIATTLVAIISPIMTYLDFLSYYNPENTYTPDEVTCYSMNPLLVLLFCAFAPLMTLYLFSFLNKRETSDFYHAIPATRQCLFFSFLAAIATWSFLILGISTVASVVAYAAFPQLYLINYSSVALMAFNCFAGSLLITASITVAMSVTGTVFTNLLVSIILIFFPRTLAIFVVKSIESAFPLVSGLDFAPLLDYNYHVPFGFVLSVFNGNMLTPLTQWKSGVYTLVVALLYTALAAWLFVRRRSEAAEHSAPSRGLQGLYRFLVGFVVSSIASLGIFTMVNEQQPIDSVDLATVILFYGLAILLVLVFEVLTSRKFRGLIRKGLRTTLWLAVANVLLIVGMFGLGRSLHFYSPKAEDIVSVRFLNGFSGENYSRGSRQEYFSSQLSQIPFTESAIKEVVADQLSYTIDLLEISRSRYHREGATAYRVQVAIDDGFSTRYRAIYLRQDDVENVVASAQSTKAYHELYTTLPDSVADIYCEGNKDCHIYNDGPNDRDALYNIIKTEFNALDVSVQRNLVLDAPYGDGTELTVLYIRFSQNAQWYYFRLPVYPHLMPRTTEYLVNTSNKNTNAAQGVQVLANDWENVFRFEMQYYDKDGASDYFSVDLTEKPELKAAIGKWVQELHAVNATTEVDTAKRFYYIKGFVNRVQHDEKDSYSYTEANYGFVNNLSEELPQWIQEYLKADDGFASGGYLSDKFKD